MATHRLPVPGGDNNNWGDILNDFLAVAHSADGSLATGAVGSAQLQNGSVTTAKVSATGTASSASYLRGDGSWNTPTPAAIGAASGNDFVSVKKFGAVGDGSTNDTAAFVQAFASGARLYVPPGIYMVDPGNLAVTHDGFTMVGAGRQSAIIRKRSNGILIDVSGASTAAHRYYTTLSDVTLDGDSHTGALIRAYYVTGLTMDRVLHLYNNDITFDAVELWDSTFIKTDWENCGGVTGATDGSGHAVRILSSLAASGFGASTDSSNALRFFSCRWESYQDGALWIGTGTGSTDGPHDIVLYGSKFETVNLGGVPLVLHDGNIFDVHFNGLYMWAASRASGIPAGTRYNLINWYPGSHTSLRDVFIGASADVVTAGVDIWAGNQMVLDNVYGKYSIAPAAAHITISGGTALFEQGAVYTNKGTNISGAPSSYAVLPPSSASAGTATIAAGAQSATATAGSNGATDAAGTVNTTASAAPSAGTIATVSFSSTKAATPHIVICPNTVAAQTAGIYVSSQSATGFSVATKTAAAASASLGFNYIISS